MRQAASSQCCDPPRIGPLAAFSATEQGSEDTPNQVLADPGARDLAPGANGRVEGPLALARSLAIGLLLRLALSLGLAFGRGHLLGLRLRLSRDLLLLLGGGHRAGRRAGRRSPATGLGRSIGRRLGRGSLRRSDLCGDPLVRAVAVDGRAVLRGERTGRDAALELD